MLDITYIAEMYGIACTVGSPFHKLYEQTLKNFHRRASGPLPLPVVSLILALESDTGIKTAAPKKEAAK